MQNTMAKSRTSYMQLSSEREEYINTPGSLYKLEEIINEHNIDITTQEIMKTLPSYTKDMTDNQRIAFIGYYWKQMSIHNIRVSFNFRRISDVERPLKSATEKYIKMLKADYGIK